MRRSPTGCHDPLITSAWRSLRSSSSPWPPFAKFLESFEASSYFSASQPSAGSIFPTCVDSQPAFVGVVGHSGLSPSGGSSKLAKWQGFRATFAFVFLKKKKKKTKTCSKGHTGEKKEKVSQQGNLLINGFFLLWSLAHLKSCLPEWICSTLYQSDN